ncbi:unnamed protein product [Rotaria sordida]|uniref:Uncharacterized protein n=1 Tax=Rotaria sordida TaxID=392033 RepID=A0A820BYE6_9BILA|nr:unnamed protein product [Rotaria sordida]
MSDKFIPHYLRSIDDTSNDREPYQHQKWSRTAIKAKTNVELRQKFPPFVVSTAISKIVHVNKYTSMKELHLLVNHVQQCTQFTIDTESEKSNAQLALIQIQTIPPRLPLLVILIELQHLSSNNLPTYVKIQEFFSLVFRSGNQLYSWGDMDKELEPIQDYHLFNWPTTALLIDIQLYFPDWYEWALAHCESCRPNHNHDRHYDGINYDNVTTQNYLSSKCICHEQSPYRPEPISDDDDEIYLNQLIEPVTNEQPEYEEISNDEQEMNDKSLVNDIELIINDNDENKPTNDVERKPTTTKHRLTHQQRSKASNQRRNRKRNNTHRIRRYQHYITRSMYYKFTMPSIKKILKQHHINYVDVKEFDGMLIIGVKNSLIQQQYQDQIPEDMFDRKHYKNHQHHHE